MKSYLFFTLFAFLLFTSYACEKDVPGCTDFTALNYDPTATESNGSCEFLRDKIVGEWEIKELIIDGTDFVNSGVFSYDKFEFDGDFEFTFIMEIGETNFNMQGDWEEDDGELEIEFSSNSSTFCSEDHDFEIDFDNDYDDLTLEDDRACDGDGIKVVLERD